MRLASRRRLARRVRGAAAPGRAVRRAVPETERHSQRKLYSTARRKISPARPFSRHLRATVSLCGFVWLVARRVLIRARAARRPAPEHTLGEVGSRGPPAAPGVGPFSRDAAARLMEAQPHPHLRVPRRSKGRRRFKPPPAAQVDS
jgi:hypothetical protein